MKIIEATQEITLAELTEAVKAFDEKLESTLPTMQSLTFIPKEEDGECERIQIKDKMLNFSPFGFNQFLSKLAIPTTYWNKVKKNKLKIDMVAEAMERSTLLTFTWHNDTVIGVLGSSTRPLAYISAIDALNKALEECPHFGPEDVVVERCEFDPYSLNLRCVIPSTETDEHTPGDPYQYGFHIQLSQVKACDTIIAPMLYRPICDNGLIDVRSQSTLIKQRSLSIAMDALAIVYSEMFEWIQLGKSGDILKSLAEYKDGDISFNYAQIQKHLKSAVVKLTSETVVIFLEEVAKGLPTGISTNPKTKMDAYSFFQLLTNTAQRLPFHAQVQIEKNVAEILAG